jgi:hypothetical protein
MSLLLSKGKSIVKKWAETTCVLSLLYTAFHITYLSISMYLIHVCEDNKIQQYEKILYSYSTLIDSNKIYPKRQYSGVKTSRNNTYKLM